jgi:hypothetical protein
VHVHVRLQEGRVGLNRLKVLIDAFWVLFTAGFPSND